MTPNHITEEAKAYVEQLSGDARKHAEIRSATVFAVAKMFRLLSQDWGKTYADLSPEQRCIMAYFDACISVPGDRSEPLRSATLMNAIEDGGYDLSLCTSCSTPVVCIPDGMPMCESCASKENNG